ncbi:hypothetical protein Taro_044039 [Colocasia esculenta]|uniref:Uncharacterized protein n=1 Tax=Colocasia esculenta TaxID=4460 RepID=A0A843WTJ4_COLES|nr:hypothetical protein [Colocasia esculenta]
MVSGALAPIVLLGSAFYMVSCRFTWLCVSCVTRVCSRGLRSVHEFPCAWQVVLRLPWLPLKLGAPGSEVSQTRGCARRLSRYSGTVGVLSSSWTPSLSRRVVVRLRERRQGQRLVRVCCLVACSALVVGGTDTSRRTGPQLVLFPVPHFREFRPESLKVSGMGLRGVTCSRQTVSTFTAFISCLVVL